MHLLRGLTLNTPPQPEIPVRTPGARLGRALFDHVWDERDTDEVIDAGKKIAGRKRHLGVDTLGLLLAVRVTAASVSDNAGGIHVLSRIAAANPRVTKAWGRHRLPTEGRRSRRPPRRRTALRPHDCARPPRWPPARPRGRVRGPARRGACSRTHRGTAPGSPGCIRRRH
nr:transposase [Kutzneria buriramensis]WKX16359.1 transposase [Kutzneria buriramensis]